MLFNIHENNVRLHFKFGWFLKNIYFLNELRNALTICTFILVPQTVTLILMVDGSDTW